MPITVQCPNPDCGGTSTIADTISGRRVLCHKCGQPFVAIRTFDGERHDTKNSQPSSTSNPFPTLPAEFGRYRVLRLLGQGGMGAVYLAEDSQLGRQVALKIPFFNASESPGLIERFLREARSAASLQHPNICTVFDAGQIEGKPFITMVYIAGTPLNQQIDPDAPMPQRRAAEIARKIAIALDHAHDKGTVHRDLKPANVMIATNGEPVVMDFGLAKRTAEVTLNEAKLTRYGGIVGTPSYMSPEQVRGDTQAMGPATDIYSLGVMLFEMLTGQTPYSGALGMVMGQILGAPVPPVHEFRPDVGLLLDAICQKAMAKDPKARFSSMSEFAQALDDYLTNPVSVVGVELVEPRRPVPTMEPEDRRLLNWGVGLVEPRRPIPTPAAVVQPVQPRRPIPAPVAVVQPVVPPLPVVNHLSSFEWDEPKSPAQVRQKPRSRTEPRQTRWVNPAILVGIAALGLGAAIIIVKGRMTDLMLSENGVRAKAPVERPEGFEYVIEGLKSSGSRQVVELDIGGGEKMEFVRIPRGTFLMGAPVGELLATGEEKPQHQVEVSRDFYLGKFEVTQAQYKAVTGESPSYFKGDRLPVEQVSWVEAVNFCEKVSVWSRRKVELPSEAEWEYACRAGNRAPFHFGTKLIGDLANCRGDPLYVTEVNGANKGTTVNVGSYPANPWGLYDMHGNVSEWCQDYYGPYEAINQRSNPIQLIRQAKDCRIIRGGSWSYLARDCRAARRFYVLPIGRDYCDGFRVCLRLD